MRKVVGVGPIVRLAARAADNVVSASHGNSRSSAFRDTNSQVSGSRSMPFSRSDWNGGRCIEPEEAQCGMLVRVSEFYYSGEATGCGAAASARISRSASMPDAPSAAHLRTRLVHRDGLVRAPCARIRAVIKAQPSDLQVNELACSFEDCMRAARTTRNNSSTHGNPSDTILAHRATVDTMGMMSLAECGAFLSQAPKGRWRKITRAQTVPIEDTRDSFRNPDKTFTPRVKCFGAYVRRLGKLTESNAVLHFVLYREAYSVNQILHRLHYELGIDADAVHLRELAGGFFGCVSQYGRCVGVTAEALVHASRHYNLRLLLFDPRQSQSIHEIHAASSASTAYPVLLPNVSAPGGPRGSVFYRILLRFVEAEAEDIVGALRNLKEGGFVNYFGVERLGVGSNGVHHMASLVGRGAMQRAVGAYLQTLAESEPFHYDYFMAYVNAEESTAAAAVAVWCEACQAARLPRALRQLLDMLYVYHTCRTLASTHATGEEASGVAGDAHGVRSAPVTSSPLVSNPSAALPCAAPDVVATAGGAMSSKAVTREDELLEKMWRLCPIHTRCRAAAAEFVWNAMASQRLIDGGYRVMRGDIVRVTDDTAEERSCAASSSRHTRYRRVESEQEAGRYGIEDVVLPVPYGNEESSGLRGDARDGHKGGDCFYPNVANSVSMPLYRSFARRHGLAGMLLHEPHDTSPDAMDEASESGGRCAVRHTTPTDTESSRGCDAEDGAGRGALGEKRATEGRARNADAACADGRSSWSASTAWHRAGVVYRTLIGKPHALQAAVINDPSSYTALKTDAFLMQERKCTQSVELDFAQRVREPCVYNVSERFAERMAHVRQCAAQRPAAEAYHGPVNSVALSFMLPDDSSPLVALRDVFALRYANFSDLYAIHGPC